MKNTVKIIIVILAILGGIFIYPRLSESNNSATGLVDLTLPIDVSKHAACRMDCRNIDAEELLEILKMGKINHEKSRKDHRGQTYAFEGRTHDYQEVRVIVAPKPDKNVIVTVIDLGKDWNCDCP